MYTMNYEVWRWRQIRILNLGTNVRDNPRRRGLLELRDKSFNGNVKLLIVPLDIYLDLYTIHIALGASDHL